MSKTAKKSEIIAKSEQRLLILIFVSLKQVTLAEPGIYGPLLG